MTTVGITGARVRPLGEVCSNKRENRNLGEHASERLGVNELCKHLQPIHDPGTGASYDISRCLVDPTILPSVGQVQYRFVFCPHHRLIGSLAHPCAGNDHLRISHSYSFRVYLCITRQVMEDVHAPSLFNDLIFEGSRASRLNWIMPDDVKYSGF